MINRIDKALAELKSKGKKAFVPFITAGDPTLDITKSIIKTLESAGVDVRERRAVAAAYDDQPADP